MAVNLCGVALTTACDKCIPLSQGSSLLPSCDTIIRFETTIESHIHSESEKNVFAQSAPDEPSLQSSNPASITVKHIPIEKPIVHNFQKNIKKPCNEVILPTYLLLDITHTNPYNKNSTPAVGRMPPLKLIQLAPAYVPTATPTTRITTPLPQSLNTLCNVLAERILTSKPTPADQHSVHIFLKAEVLNGAEVHLTIHQGVLNVTVMTTETPIATLLTTHCKSLETRLRERTMLNKVRLTIATDTTKDKAYDYGENIGDGSVST